jgi:hypothetical protein
MEKSYETLFVERVKRASKECDERVKREGIEDWK